MLAITQLPPLSQHPLLDTANKSYINAIQHLHTPNNRLVDFLIILGLISLLVLCKVINPNFFKGIYNSFDNNSKSLKVRDSILLLPNLILDLFFAIVFGLYFYCIYNYFENGGKIAGSIDLKFLASISGIFIIIYVVRYLSLKYWGWQLDIIANTNRYNNVILLLNRIIAIGLLPFVIILLFAGERLAPLGVYGSFAWIAIVFLNRLSRTGNITSYFERFSKLHFFMYLCAFEILPILVLVKFIQQNINII